MYARLFGELADDYALGGESRAILGETHRRPVHDAIPLRLAAAVHAPVLGGWTHPVARHYPSVGGAPGPHLLNDFLDACRELPSGLEAALQRPVQTNEVGRSVVHLSLVHWLACLGVDSFDHLEVGASAGLTMNFERYCAETGYGTMGDPSSPIRFGPDWFEQPPPLAGRPATVRQCVGCDTSPVDLSLPGEALHLLSYVWPDQQDRFDRARLAIEIARAHPPSVDESSADDWLEQQLADRISVPVQVFHSIVWQYLGPDVQRRMVSVLHHAGRTRSLQAPLVWARMEPAGGRADVRVTVWTGGDPQEMVLATVGFHGRGLAWASS